MSMAEQQTFTLPEDDRPARQSFKTYERPQLIEWGTLTELTKQVKHSGLQDLPLDSGTEPE